MHTTVTVAALVIQPYVLWPWVAGGTLALIGVLAARTEAANARGWDKILALGPLFFGVPLAAFGAEHLTLAKFIMLGVPAWIPWHLFWAYFVGCALIAAALSITTNIQTRLSGILLGVMLCLFVFSMHIPRVISDPKDRFAWAVALRDLSFAGGAWALAGASTRSRRTQTEEWRTRGANNWVTLGRFMIAIPAIFFALEHFLHPSALPGVPLEKLTPLWIPGRMLIGYLTGAVLLVSGTCLLLGTKMRMVATYLGVLLLVLVLLVYLPMAIAIPSAADGGLKLEGLNYFFDTLLFAGAVLVLAGALPKDSPFD